jgi:RNA recognition motif-containing protein
MDNGSTLGYAFIEYATEEQAQWAVGEAKQNEFSKGVTLSVNIFDDFDEVT